jgi:hypothetical protein
VINITQGGGTINDVICVNGIQGGGSTPQVFIGLLPPTDTTIGGVRTLEGSGISIDADGIIRSTIEYNIQAGNGITLSNVSPQSATINVAVAGQNAQSLGGVYVNPTFNPGVQVSADGFLALTPPQGGGLGGVKAGQGVSIDPLTGVLTATGSGGTITGVGAGVGLSGGGISGAVTLFLTPATPTTIGGVYPGENVTIAPDGQISVADAALGVLTVTGSDPIEITGTTSNPIIGVKDGSLTGKGVVTLTDAVDSTSTSSAATPNSVRIAYDLADGALSRQGGGMEGVINFAPGQTFPNTISSTVFTQKGQILVAVGNGQFINQSAGAPGQVLTPDPGTQTGLVWSNTGGGTVTEVTGVTPVQVLNGTTTPEISVDAASTTTPGISQLYDGVDSTSTTLAATANAVKTAYDAGAAAAANNLPLAGGTMTGQITFAAGQAFPDVLPLAGGTMAGLITFFTGQTFPGVVQSVGAIDSTINVGGTPENPLLDVAIATTSQLGVVQPDGTSITIDGNGVISAAAATGFLALTGGTMSGDITFSGTQTFPGVLAEGALSADLPAVIGGTPANPVLSVNAATTSALGVVQPDGTTITVSPTGVISSVPSSVPPPDYGNFYSDNTQQPQALITGQPVTLNQTVAANNFQIIDGSKVTASSAGVYNLQFSIQLVSTNQGGDVEIWLAKNGVAVDESNTTFHTKNANEAEFAALNYVETLASGDYLELIWATDNLDMTLAATASTMGGPNIPSVILTIVPVGA